MKRIPRRVFTAEFKLEAIKAAPNAVWVADITYIPTDEGWLFLAAITERYLLDGHAIAALNHMPTQK